MFRRGFGCFLQIANKQFVNNRIYSSSIVDKSTQTICAIASGYGKAGVSVIRVSGNQVQNALMRFSKIQKLPQPRVATFQAIINPFNGDVIDSGIVIYFPAPKSFTGEDVAEFQVHGSQAVVNLILKCLTRMNHIRLAEAGEFARRAVYNNKMDLTQAEGLADLIDAETEQQRKLAIQQAEGITGKLYENWRTGLVECISHLQADVDYGETDELEMQLDHVYNWVAKLESDIKEFLAEYNKGTSIRDGIQVVIYGAPNAGKSSFYNMLCQDDKAIVSRIAGTTRDVLETPFDIGGFKTVLLDTAGIRGQTYDPVEGLGIFKAIDALNHPNTHLHILVCSYTHLVIFQKHNPRSSFLQYIKQYMRELGLAGLINPSAVTVRSLFKKRTIIILNKVDRIMSNETYSDLKEDVKDNLTFVSCLMRVGSAAVLDHCAIELQHTLCDNFTEGPRLTSVRQKRHLESCTIDLQDFLRGYEEDEDQDLAIALRQLRCAANKLANLTGKVLDEEVLNYIFKNFCIGK